MAMDSQKRNETRDRRREEALARRVGEALDQLARSDAEECPDAELIAAYHEKSLQQDEIVHWEGHFAACTRCRKILRVLAASADTPLDEKEVGRLGQLAAAHTPLEGASQMAKPAYTNRLNWRGRWLAPALGVAAVLTVWFAMRPPWRAADQNPSRTLIAQAPRNEPLPSTGTRAIERHAEVSPRKSAKTDAGTPKDIPVTGAQSPNRVIGEVAPSSDVAENTLGAEKKEKAESNSAPVAPSAPVQPPEPSSLKSALALSRKAQVQAAEEAPEVSAADPAGSVAANAPARENQALAAPDGAVDKIAPSAGANQPLAARNFKSVSNLEGSGGNAALIRTPSRSISWRVGKGGSIERSTDTGRTWVLQTSPLQEEWLGGTAVTDKICWIMGRNGAIARTTDGEHWEKIAPPPSAADPSGKFPDWTGITAANAQTATITADGERGYATRDAGKTWKAQ
jgi:Photosynthesis system II assembly factor YCF48